MDFNVIYIGNNGKGCDYIHCQPGFNVVAVICQQKMINKEILACCFLRDIPLIEIAGHNSFKEAFKKVPVSFDFAIMLSFGLMIKQDILDLYKIYNIHMSYLPFYKGKNSTFYATMAGEKSIGASIHQVVAGIDEGPIISRKLIPYYYWMGEIELWEKLLQQIPLLLSDLLLFLTEKDYRLIENDNDNYCKPVEDSMLIIDEDTQVKDILNLIRSQQSYNGAKFIYKSNTYLIKGIKISLLKSDEVYIYENKIVIKEDMPIGIKINDKYFINFN